MAEAKVSAGKPPRERLLDVAAELFYRRGIHAVGIDEIIAAAGVAKMSLYRSFASKDELVAAYLERRDARYWQWWNATIPRARSPRPIRRSCASVCAILRRPSARAIRRRLPIS